MKPAILKKLLAHILLGTGAAIMMYPLLYGVVASFNTAAEYIRAIGILPIPPALHLDNYAIVFHPKVLALLGGSLWVTFIRMAWYMFWNSAVAILCGYVFARLQFRGKEIVFWVLLGSMLVPGIVFQIPLYVMMARWPLVGGNDLLGQGGSGLINQLPAILLPGMINVYFIFLLRQSFYSIPIDYEEAARLDGANFFQVLYYVYRPMLMPVIAVMGINTVIANWNDYVWPMMVISGNRDLWPTALMFQRLMAGGIPSDVAKNLVVASIGANITNTPLILTFGVVATIPAVIIFFIFQRYFIEGMQGVGIKG
jgi:multiple sugar transport system permease protein